MLIFKCDLCKKQWDAKQGHNNEATFSRYKNEHSYSDLVYHPDKDKDIEKILSDFSYCHICIREIDKAKEAAAAKAEQEAIKSLQV